MHDAVKLILGCKRVCLHVYSQTVPVFLAIILCGDVLGQCAHLSSWLVQKASSGHDIIVAHIAGGWNMATPHQVLGVKESLWMPSHGCSSTRSGAEADLAATDMRLATKTTASCWVWSVQTMSSLVPR